jgi:hypothetical protein
MRSTGKPVEGHVEADSEEWAFHALANNGIITESLRPDPSKSGQPAATGAAAATKLVEPLLPPYVPPSYSPAPPPATSGPSAISASAARAATPPPGTFAVSGGVHPAAPPASPVAPESAAPGSEVEPRRQFDNALEGALDGASSQIDFDALTERYRGKKVWVIDRDKIRRNVARVVDTAAQPRGPALPMRSMSCSRTRAT